MADSDQEKTEDATPQRREDFRKRGQVAQTRELASVFLLLGAAIIVWLMGQYLLQEVWDIFSYSFGDTMATSIRQDNVMFVVKLVATKSFMILSPIMGIALILSIASTVVQIGFLQNEEALKPDIKKINPMSGLKRIFSLKSLVEGLKATIKMLLIVSVVGMIIKSEILMVPHLIQLDISQIFKYIEGLTAKLLGGVGFFMIVVAGLDYFFQRWDLEQKMKMSKQEVKEELKSREGDPMIKARIRRVQREMANRRMMEAVPKADVIITNPTHIAVALQYKADLPAPKIVAKGAGYVAEKIKKLAKEHNVPIVENKPLARTIFKTLKIGAMIPRELFNAVAEVLAYVYKLKRKGRH